MRKPSPLPPLAEIRDALEYNPETGVLTWKRRDGVRPCINARYVGKPAGAANGFGYLQVRLNGKKYLAHRLAYALAHGVDPGALEVDHIDRDRSNNRLDNLRLATAAENQQNAPGRRTKNGRPVTSKYRGVSWHKKSRRWYARLWSAKRCTYLGLFDTQEEAAAAFDAAARDLHGEFARLNLPG